MRADDLYLAIATTSIAVSRRCLRNANGTVVLTIPSEPPSPARASKDPFAVNGCPSGWFCFYKDINFNGRKLQFSDCRLDGVTQYLTTYGFGNQTSSWVVNDTIFG